VSGTDAAEIYSLTKHTLEEQFRILKRKWMHVMGSNTPPGILRMIYNEISESGGHPVVRKWTNGYCIMHLAMVIHPCIQISMQQKMAANHSMKFLMLPTVWLRMGVEQHHTIMGRYEFLHLLKPTLLQLLLCTMRYANALMPAMMMW